MFWKSRLHFIDIFGKIVLPGKDVHAWKMVDLLVRLHFIHCLYTDS